MAKVAVAGWHHLTNTLIPTTTGQTAFQAPVTRPSCAKGQDVFRQLGKQHVPLMGAVNALRYLRHHVEPVSWMAADPSGPIERAVFEDSMVELLEDLAAAGPLDAIYLDLHGAMAAEHLPDADGEILRRIRECFGEHLPLVASVSLHANITPMMLAYSDALEVCHSYPQADQGNTGGRAATILHKRLTNRDVPWFVASRRPGFDIPFQATATGSSAFQELVNTLPQITRDTVVSASIALGYPGLDTQTSGPSIVAYGHDQAAVEQAADDLLTSLYRVREHMNIPVDSADRGMERCRHYLNGARRPVVIADVEDGTEGGSSGDTTTLLRDFLQGGFRGAVFASITDRKAVSLAFDAGVNQHIKMQLGGQSGLNDDEPLDSSFRVVALGNGDFPAMSPWLKGSYLSIGPVALLEHLSVQIVVVSQPMPVNDPGLLAHLGLDSSKLHVIVVKSAVDYLACYAEQAMEFIAIAGSGFTPMDLARFRALNPAVMAANPLTGSNKLVASADTTAPVQQQDGEGNAVDITAEPGVTTPRTADTLAS